jgi:DNA polymerase-1
MFQTATATNRGAFDLSIPDPVDVRTEKESEQWLDYMIQAAHQRGSLGLDSETSGRVKHRDWVVKWSISDGTYRLCLDASMLPQWKERVLENPEINFDMTNVPFDFHMFANTGVDISKAGNLMDTTMQSWLWNENNLGRHGLKECILDHFGRNRENFEDVFGKIPAKKKNTIQLSSGDLIAAVFNDPTKRWRGVDYASLDAYDSTHLRHHFDDLLGQVLIYSGKTLREYFHEIEVPYTKVLLKMERRGFTIDAGYFRSIAPQMRMTLIQIEREFAKAAGEIVNLRSPDQLVWFFHEKLQRPVAAWTKGGKSGIKKPSIDADVLDEWAGEGDPYARMIITHRKVAKILGTYVDGLSEHIDHNFRIHTSLLQHGTVTGRLSSKAPNLQNIPRASEDKFKIREAFIAGPFKKLMVADYEQLEMRLMAHFSGDEKMIDAIRRGVDIHCLTVSELYGFEYDEVVAAKKAGKKYGEGKLGRELTEREADLILKRQQCKAAGFGIIYGIGGELLAANLTAESGVYISPEEGKELIQKWLSVFPGVKRFIEQTKTFIWRNGYVQTILGRFRRFGDLHGMSKGDAARCERQAVNAIIQGTAADIARVVMIVAENDPVLKELGCELLLQVHDELIWELPMDNEICMKAKARAKEIMENPFQQALAVPLPVEIGFGENWAAAK